MPAGDRDRRPRCEDRRADLCGGAEPVAQYQGDVVPVAEIADRGHPPPASARTAATRMRNNRVSSSTSASWVTGSVEASNARCWWDVDQARQHGDVAEVDHIRTARRDIALRHVHNPAGRYFDQRVFHDGVRIQVEQPRRRKSAFRSPRATTEAGLNVGGCRIACIKGQVFLPAVGG